MAPPAQDWEGQDQCGPSSDTDTASYGADIGGPQGPDRDDASREAAGKIHGQGQIAQAAQSVRHARPLGRDRVTRSGP